MHGGSRRRLPPPLPPAAAAARSEPPSALCCTPPAPLFALSQVPFGPVAFFPGKLVDTGMVYVERGGAGAAGTAAGPTVGPDQLEQMTPAQAAERLQQATQPAPTAQQQQQQQAHKAQQALPPRPPRPPQPRPAPPQPRASQPAPGGQQLANLVGGKSPENLDALRRALEQLGAALDEQAVAGGQLPSTEVRVEARAGCGLVELLLLQPACRVRLLCRRPCCVPVIADPCWLAAAAARASTLPIGQAAQALPTHFLHCTLPV